MQETTERARGLLSAGRGGDAIALLLAVQDDPELVAQLGPWLQRTLTSGAVARHYADLCGPRGPVRPRILHLARSLAAVRLHEAALALLDLGYPARDPFAGYYRAQWAMAAGDLAHAIAAADVTIQNLMRRQQPVDSFVAEGLRAARPAALLRFSPREIAESQRLRQPLVVRWEALHRSREYARADQMRQLCLRLFPTRVSVWVMAGNHALDQRDLDGARHHFAQALVLDSAAIGALAGMAIEREMHKDWEAALTFRRRAADAAQAWDGDDPASLHRVIRYAAALGRLNRWQEAGRHLRRCVRAGAFEQLPAERPVLLRAFCGPLYSPAMIATLVKEDAQVGAAHAASAERALQDAAALGTLVAALQTADHSAFERQLLAGMCAWEMRDPELAYQHFDEADALREADMTANYLLLASASEVGSAELGSIARYAAEVARATYGDPSADEAQRFFALLTLQRIDGSDPGWPAPAGLYLQLWPAARRLATDPGAACDVPAPHAGTAADQLRLWVAFREALTVAGVPTETVAQASAGAHLAWAQAGASR